MTTRRDEATLAGDELANVIREAMVEYCKIKPLDRGPLAAYIAAAVSAHLLSEAVLERAVDAFLSKRTTHDGIRAAIMAALAAPGGGRGGS